MRFPRTLQKRGALALVAGLIAATACSDATAPPVPEAGLKNAPAPVSPPSLVTFSHAGQTYRFWPYLGHDFTATLPDETDPVNALILGDVDPLAVRAALMLLDGNRSAPFDPAVFPLFGCTWEDAIGDIVVAYAEPVGWVGPAVQLQCGAFGPLRFHVRLYDAGGYLLAPAHFDFLIPGTQTHQLLSWELGEQFLAADLARAGIVLGAVQTGSINASPGWRTIAPQIYNLLPVGLRALIGGPLGSVTDPVPVPTNGSASVFELDDTDDALPGLARQRFVLQFGQMIPKPFCSTGPFDYIYVSGPLQFDQRIVVTPSGNYVSSFHATGMLDVTPMNVLTSPPTPAGPTYQARVNEHHKAIYTNAHTLASSLSLQILLPPSEFGRGRMMLHLTLGPGGAQHHAFDTRCGS